ncbi:MAG TPA: ATP-binding protein [Chloroflexota bacterium]|nr:ATP-binding protein [Chloroflexota bacterium]
MTGQPPAPGAAAAAAPDLSFLHLQVELLRIDVRIHRAVQLWQEAHRAEGADVFAGQYISDAEISALLRKPLGASWWSGVAVAPGTDHAELAAQAERRTTGLRETARKQGERLRLDHLAAAFGLSPLEVDALLVCLAPALDRRYERFYGYLQDDATRKWPSPNLILELLCKPGPERLLRLRHFDPEAPLFRNQLLRRVPEPGVVDPPALNQALRPDEAVISWLLGRFRPHADLGAHATLVGARPVEEEEASAWVPDETRAALETLRAAAASGARPVLVFHGKDAESQWMAARALSGVARRPLLRVRLKELLEPAPVAPGAAAPPVAVATALKMVRAALRDARLTGAIPFLAEWDVISRDGTVPPEVLHEVTQYPGYVVLAGKNKWLPQGADPESQIHWLEFGTPAYAQRRRLWRYLLPEPAVPVAGPKAPKKTRAAKVPALDVDGVAGQFVLTTGQIRDSVTLAHDMAAQRGGAAERVSERDLFAAARAHASPTLGKLARHITPRYGWDDLVLPPDQVQMLRELVSTVRGRPKVLEEWGVGKKLASSAGVTVLFSGPPGTGKTMSAEVVAGELGLDLYKIDLSTVISKYIGETEKNLEQIFVEAETSNAILFFDEADAIFGKRSEVRDAHDRYANIEISYLLQRMESYDGVTILATNLRSNLDAAFTRRLQFVVDIPFPEEEDRLRIWKALLPSEVPCAPNVNLAALANRYKMAGGNIRNVIVSATYLAAANGGRITNEYLLHGVKRELQKMGRLLKDGELAR